MRKLCMMRSGNQQQANEREPDGTAIESFPLEFGRVTVYEDRLVVRSGFRKRKKLREVPFDELQAMQVMNHRDCIRTKNNKLIGIGTLKRESRRKLQDLWRSFLLRRIKSSGNWSGVVPGPTRSDRISPFIQLVIAIAVVTCLFDPFSIRWSRLDPAAFLILATGMAGMLLMYLIPAMMFWQKAFFQSRMKGSWRIDREGFWRTNGVGMPSVVQIQPDDGVRYPKIRYGGRVLPWQQFVQSDLFYDLLALHLRRRNAPFTLQPLWPPLARSLIIPVLLAGWWFAREAVNFPVQVAEISGILIVGGLSFIGMVVAAIYSWYSRKQKFSALMDRIETLKGELGW